jgi:biotin carboxyl carrier protein
MSRSTDQGIGQIILATPVSFTVYAWSAAGLTLSLSLVLGLCSHAVTEKTDAVIVPENGITSIRTDEAGILVDYLVDQGDKVVIGQPIAKFQRLSIAASDEYSTEEQPDAASAARTPQTMFDLVSQMDGSFYRSDKQIGEFAGVSEPIAMIARDGPLSVKLMVSEKARRALRVGTKLPVTIESYKPRREKIIDGTVVFTANAPTQSTNYATMETTTQYQIVVRLDGNHSPASRNELLGRSVKARIIVEKKKLYQWIFDPIGALFK